MNAEETYVIHLSKISKTHAATEADMFNCFGSAETTFRRATVHYERSIEQTIVIRKNLIRSMWSEIDKLVHVKVIIMMRTFFFFGKCISSYLLINHI